MMFNMPQRPMNISVFFSLVVAALAAVTVVPTEQLGCCLKLQATVENSHGKVLFPTTIGYNVSLASYYSQQEEQIMPACVFQPSSASDLASVLDPRRFLRSKCQFAIRGGGHTPFAGSANIRGGVTIDLSQMKSMIVSRDRSSITIGTGNRWGTVYQFLDAQGLSTAGGRVSGVGVSGLTLGGGISFFSPRIGFVCDNAINFEVVTSEGDILNANAGVHQDLFKALRGGSNNFGVVTSITLKAFPQGKFWGGFHVTSTEYTTQVLEFFTNFTKSPTYDVYGAMICSFGWSEASGWVISNNIDYTKDDPPQPNPPVFKALTDIPPIASTTRISNLTDFTVELNSFSPNGERAHFQSYTYKADLALTQYIIDVAQTTIIPSISHVTNLTFSVSFQPLPPVLLNRSGRTPGGNVLGLDGSSGPLFNGMVSATWAETADDSSVYSAVQALFDKANQYAETNGLSYRYLYLNYAAAFQRPIASYGTANVAFMKMVSRKYDPTQFFQKNVPGGFKLDG